MISINIVLIYCSVLHMHVLRASEHIYKTCIPNSCGLQINISVNMLVGENDAFGIYGWFLRFVKIMIFIFCIQIKLNAGIIVLKRARIKQCYTGWIKEGDKTFELVALEAYFYLRRSF